MNEISSRTEIYKSCPILIDLMVGLGWAILISTNQGMAETPLIGIRVSSRHSENYQTSDLSIFFQHLRSLRGMVLSWQRKTKQKKPC